MPIGGVIACKDTVIPNAVGVDIGCGMLAVRSSLCEISKDELKAVVDILHETIPVGFNHRKEAQTIPDIPKKAAPISFKQAQAAAYQLGTLGGGNHFIELQQGDDGFVWFMIHSGSRNLGKQVAEHYNKKAIEANAEQNEVPPSWQLAYLEAGTELFDKYICEMQYCLSFAQANRDRMSMEVMAALSQVMKGVTFNDPINIHHNYAALEEHFGEQLWVHRKGATSARLGEAGIIPGSQGSASYIMRGKGNTESFQSCSHGAGRKLGRNQAVRTLDLATEQKRLDDMGVLHQLRTAKDLDEAAGAYKDIAEVMAAQSDLVDIVVELRPLAVVKG
jgi:tRNA-splicing ligase RtcB